MSSSEVLGIGLGNWLSPPASFDNVWQMAKTKVASSHFELFTMGWTGFGYRSKAACEHLAAFRLQFALEPAASHEERFLQDSHAFGFVSNACAASENVVFAAHVVALSSSGTPPDKDVLRRLPSVMIKVVKTCPTTTDLGTMLEELFARNERIGLSELRDVFLHRGRFPRNHFVGGEFDGKVTIPENLKDAPEDWLARFEWGPSCLDPFNDWAADLSRKTLQHFGEVLSV